MRSCVARSRGSIFTRSESMKALKMARLRFGELPGRQQRRASGENVERDDVQRVADLALAVDQALDEVHSKSVIWHEAARQEMGVSD
jgi:hypothetical protein